MNYSIEQGSLSNVFNSRALDNQLYVAVTSPARDENHSYIAWGHSAITSPWGEVISQCESTECIIYADIDPSEVDRVKTIVPITKQKRHDLYKLVNCKE